MSSDWRPNCLLQPMPGSRLFSDISHDHIAVIITSTHPDMLECKTVAHKTGQTRLEVILRCAPIVTNPVGIGIGTGVVISHCTDLGTAISAAIGAGAAAFTVIFVVTIGLLIRLTPS
jgi:hypothetical protein